MGLSSHQTHLRISPLFLWEQTLVLEGIQLKVYMCSTQYWPIAGDQRLFPYTLSQIFCMARWRATLLWFMELYAIVAARIKSVAVKTGIRHPKTTAFQGFPHPFAHFAHSSLGFSEVQRIHPWTVFAQPLSLDETQHVPHRSTSSFMMFHDHSPV